MRPSSPLFNAAITSAHTIAVRVSARFGDRDPVDVPVHTGSVSMDRTRPVRRSLTMTIPGREWITDDPQGPLSPYGGVLTVERGIRYPNGDIELISLGVFAIQGETFDRFVGETTITANDLFTHFIDDRFEAPRTIAKGPFTTDRLRELIEETLPDAALSVAPGVEAPYPGGTVFEEDRAGAITDIATGLGCDIYANADGGFTLAPTPTLDDPPVATLASGPGGVLVSVQGERTRDGVYNAVVARSEPTDPDEKQVSATVQDLNPLSPTRWEGPFGRKPKFYASPLLTSEEQAAKAARSILADSIGLARDADLATVPDPRLEVGDVIRLDYGQLVENHIIDTLTIPLTAEGSWTGTTRSATSKELLR